MSKPIDQELLEVLDAREKRWQLRLALSQQYNLPIVTITMCLPLKYRTNGQYKEILFKLYNDFLELLTKERFSFVTLTPCDSADGPAYFVAVDADTTKIKHLCVSAEDSFTLGRILDIDLMGAAGTPLSRSDFNLPPRKCFICENPASVCVSRKLHTKEYVEKAIEEMLTKA